SPGCHISRPRDDCHLSYALNSGHTIRSAWTPADLIDWVAGVSGLRVTRDHHQRRRPDPGGADADASIAWRRFGRRAVAAHDRDVSGPVRGGLLEDLRRQRRFPSPGSPDDDRSRVWSRVAAP